jgi:hypothetical protein
MAARGAVRAASFETAGRGRPPQDQGRQRSISQNHCAKVLVCVAKMICSTCSVVQPVGARCLLGVMLCLLGTNASHSGGESPIIWLPRPRSVDVLTGFEIVAPNERAPAGHALTRRPTGSGPAGGGALANGGWLSSEPASNEGERLNVR